MNRTWTLLAIAAAGASAIGAFVWFGTAVDEGPEVPLPAAYATGLAAAERGDTTAAIGAFEEALAADPNAFPLLYALGSTHIEAGRPLVGAIYLSAYLEAFPNAPNASRVKDQVAGIAATYRDAAEKMAKEAVVQLDAIGNDQTRASRAAEMAGRFIDLGFGFDDLARHHPSGMTVATLNHVTKRGLAASAPEKSFKLLTVAIDSEADAAAKDIASVGCTELAAEAPRICSMLSLDRAQACYDEQAGVGATVHHAVPGNRTQFARTLEFWVAVNLWLTGADHERLVKPLANAYASQRERALAEKNAFWPGRCTTWPAHSPASIIYLTDGVSMEAWINRGRINLAKPGKSPAPPPALAPLKAWRTVVTEKRVDVGPERTELAFDDAVFGDLGTAVGAIGRETTEARAGMLSSLALKLGLLTQRLDPK
ncbi:MAG: hypothetical protein GC190_11865 [Alphaproteobacteria bacterium]|nr:hypothetical protein [Alphaproteobacteria bacterium]